MNHTFSQSFMDDCRQGEGAEVHRQVRQFLQQKAVLPWSSWSRWKLVSVTILLLVKFYMYDCSVYAIFKDKRVLQLLLLKKNGNYELKKNSKQ